MEFSNLDLKYKEDWAVVKIDRPQALNFLNQEVLRELKQAITNLEQDSEVKVIVITGAGKAFVAGADIAAMKEMDSLAAKEFSKLGHKTFAAIEESSKPVIAAVNGFALGAGCELALACDLRVASERAKFGQPEINLGIIPGFGGTQRLAKAVGEAKAKELIFTGQHIKAEAALEIGLINKITEKDKLMAEVEKLASQIASKSAVMLNLAKEAVNEGLEKEIAEGSKLEANLFSLCFSTQDQKIGMEAFLNDEQADFVDK